MRKSSHPLSLAALTVLELSPHQMVETAAAAGYQYIGLRLIPATAEERHIPLVGSTAEMNRTREALTQTGIKVLDIEIFRLKPETDIKRDYLAAMECGAELGATEVLVAGNDPDRNRCIENLAALCDLVKPFGLHPSLEFMPWTDIPDLNTAAATVQAVGRDNAGLLIDAFHLNRSCSSVKDIGKLPTQWLRYAQLCDIVGPVPQLMDEILYEARNQRSMPGEGDIDLAGLVHALPEAIPLSLEVPTADLAQQGVSALNRAQRVREAALKILQL